MAERPSRLIDHAINLRPITDIDADTGRRAAAAPNSVHDLAD
jgi:hypothetical protein